MVSTFGIQSLSVVRKKQLYVSIGETCGEEEETKGKSIRATKIRQLDS